MINPVFKNYIYLEIFASDGIIGEGFALIIIVNKHLENLKKGLQY